MSDGYPVNLDKLTQAFPATAIQQRRVGGGRMLDYVQGHTVIHRLNEATGNHWEFKVLGLERVAIGSDASLMTATVELCLPGLGCRQHIGVQMVHANGGEDLVKGAVTDALKKAATLFGVGLELYGPDYEAGEVSSQVPTTGGMPATRQNAPGRPPSVEPVSGQGQRANGAQQGSALSSGDAERTPGGATMRSLNYSLVLAHEAGIGDDDVHRWCGDQFGKVSRNDLDQPQMGALIDWLKALPKTQDRAPSSGWVTSSAQEAPTPGEIVSWSDFWKVVRPLGYRDKPDLEAKLGFSISTMTPQEALDSVNAVMQGPEAGS